MRKQGLDILSKILDSLHFNSTFYFATNFHSPWGVEVPPYKNVARFHYVTQGSCWVRIDGSDEAQLLSSGDLIVIPHGAVHILSDTVDRKPISLDEVSHLPSFIIKREAEGVDFAWMRDTLRFLSYTATAQHDGSSAIIKRLSEVIFIQAIRFWNTQSGVNKGFIAALNDKHLSSGLKAFHQDVAAVWTVEKLARESSKSRSLFSDRFKQYLDLSPMQYVTNWRMQSARQILMQSDLPLDGIAREVGYESAAAFSKAFKRIFNQNPGEYRRLAG